MIVLAFLLWIGIATGHPVTFKNGIAVTSIHRPMMTMTQLNYTVHRNLAVAASYTRLEMKTSTIEMPSLHANVLVKRWNKLGSQANLYALAGMGYDLGTTNNNWVKHLRAYTGLQFDYETQRIYTALITRALPQIDSIQNVPISGQYRLGIAPYVANYDELQIWFVGQVEYMSDMEQETLFTPMLRFFYRTVLWETGVSLNGTYWFQMMAHF